MTLATSTEIIYADTNIPSNIAYSPDEIAGIIDIFGDCCSIVDSNELI